MLERIPHGSILELRLARPPVNALNEALLVALAEAIRQAPDEGYAALVLSGNPGMFSAGMDVPELLSRERDGVGRSWSAFFAVCEALARSPIPTVAAITGHSPAGGAVIAIHCDYRVMADGAFKIGLNEVQVGLFVPAVIQKVLARLVGPHRAERLLVAGAMVDSQQALKIGMVDELATVDDVIPQAMKWAQDHLRLPQQALRRTREIARADLHALYATPFSVDGFLDSFFGAETQQTLKGLVARLKGKG